MKTLFFFIWIFLSNYCFATSSSNDEKLINTIKSDLVFYKEHLEQNNPHKLSPKLVKKLKGIDATLFQIRSDKSIISSDKAKELIEVHHELQKVLSLLDHEYLVQFSLNNEDENTADAMSANSTLRGVVKDDEMGSTIPYATVKLYDATGSYLRSALTDIAGRYFFTNLNPGDYVLSASEASYSDLFFDGVVCEGGLGTGCQLSDITPVNLGSNEIKSGIDFNMLKLASITGQIIDQETGSGISANISVYDHNFNYISSSYSNYNSGEFKLSLNNGNYYLIFSSYGYFSEIFNNQLCIDECDFNSAQVIEVNVGADTSIGIIQLLKHRALGGKVTDVDTNEPLFVPGFEQRIEVLNAINGYIEGNTGFNDIEPDGTWKIEGIAPGNYLVRSRTPGYLAQYHTLKNCDGEDFNRCNISNPRVFEHNTTSSLLNINFRHKLGGKISGRIYYTGSNGNSSSEVSLYNSDGLIIDRTNTYDEHYTFSGLSNGTYYISAKSRYSNSEYLPTLRPSSYCELHDGSNDCLNPTSGLPITINNYEHNYNNNIRLKPAATITGKLTDNNNNNITSAQVHLYYKSRYPSGYPFNSTYTDNNGRYQFNGLKLSEYYIVTDSHEHVNEIYDNRPCHQAPCDQSNATVIRIGNGQTYGDYNFRLNNAAKINFKITSPSDVELRGNLQAIKTDGTYWTSANVDSSGLVSLNLPNGQYKFLYTDQYSNFISKPYGGSNCDDDCFPLQGTTVSIADNSTYQFNMSVDAHFVLYGDIAGNNNNRKRIDLYRNNTSISWNSTYSNHYKIKVPSTGPVKIGISSSGYFYQFYDNAECQELQCALNQADPINAVINGKKKVDFDLRPIAQLSGKVIDRNGQGVSGLSIKIRTEDGNLTRNLTSTNNDGSFSIDTDITGNIYLVTGSNNQFTNTLYGNIACDNYECDYSAGTSIQVTPGSINDNLNITVVEQGSLLINTVKYFDGSIAANISISVYDATTNNYVKRFQTDENGIGTAKLKSGNYKLRGTKNNRIYTVYPEISCENLSTNQCLNLGEAITITNEETTSVSGFKIHHQGTITVTVKSQENNQPLQSVKVQLYTSNYNRRQTATTNELGQAVLPGLEAGEYYVFVETDENSAFISSLYQNINCSGGIGVDCLFTEGTLITATNNQNQDIEVLLKSKPSIILKAVDGITMNPLKANYRIYSLSGELLNYSYTEMFENTIHLDEGNYYAVMESNSYTATAYPDVRCENSQLNTCSDSYSMIEVSENQINSYTTQMQLDYGIAGYVINKNTGEPIQDVIIDLWNAQSTTNNLASTVTAENGGFILRPYIGYSYYLSTDANSDEGYIDMVYSDVYCEAGPVVLGLCDLTPGSIITLPNNTNHIENILIELVQDPVFKSGFE